MSWIKEANKVGKYEGAYKGFRIYCTKEPEIKQSEVIRDGEAWRHTEFIKGWYVGIDKTGFRLEYDHMLPLACRIDFEVFQRR